MSTVTTIIATKYDKCKVLGCGDTSGYREDLKNSVRVYEDRVHGFEEWLFGSRQAEADYYLAKKYYEEGWDVYLHHDC